jgi:hypothetical protein
LPFCAVVFADWPEVGVVNHVEPADPAAGGGGGAPMGEGGPGNGVGDTVADHDAPSQ